MSNDIHFCFRVQKESQVIAVLRQTVVLPVSRVVEVHQVSLEEPGDLDLRDPKDKGDCK
jgi:hypothetical protein